MDERTQTEYDRIKAGPHEGYFTFLHHDWPIVEASHNVMERVAAILRDKEANEHYDRLRHIYPVPLDMVGVYYEITAAAWKVYEEARAPAEKALLELIPNCGWNGKSILG